MDLNIYQKQVFSFSHWTRNSWAVFQSLGLQIRISTLSIALLMGSFVSSVFAQEVQTNQSMEEFDLDTLEIMGELTPELAIELARVVQVIEADDLESSSIRCLQDAINTSQQIDIRQRGKNDVQADLSIRGSTFDQVMVLLNGFDMTDPQTGHHSLNLPIAFSQIHHIEVLSGAASRVLGPNAYAGAINFVSPKPKSNLLDISIGVGDFGSINTSVGISIKKNKLSHFLSADYSSSNGYTDNTDFKRYSLFYFGEYNNGRGDLSWQFAFSDKSFGANSFYTPKYPNQYEQLRNIFGGIKYKTKGKISTLTQLHYRANVDRFELFRDGYEIPKWYRHHNYHFNQVLQLSSKAWLWTAIGKSTLAANIRNESILSNVLGNAMSDTITALFDKEGYYDKSDNRLYATLSGEHVYSINNLKIAAGLMYYYYPNTNNKSGFFPGFDLNYRLSSHWKAFAGVNTGMRLPTFTDLYYSGPSNIGNPDLIAESQVSYELGSSASYSVFKLDINVFVNQAKNSIDWVRKADTLKWQPINITEVSSHGFDISFELNPKNMGLKWINSMSVKWSYLHKETSSPDYQSHYVMDYLKNKIVMGLNHKVYKNISISYLFHYHQRVGEYLYYNSIDNTTLPMEYKSYGLLDVRLNWKYNQWHIYADISNMLDVKYQDYGNLIQPGRWFSIGVRKKIDL